MKLPVRVMWNDAGRRVSGMLVGFGERGSEPVGIICSDNTKTFLWLYLHQITAAEEPTL